MPSAIVHLNNTEVAHGEYCTVGSPTKKAGTHGTLEVHRKI